MKYHEVTRPDAPWNDPTEVDGEKCRADTVKPVDIRARFRRVPLLVGAAQTAKPILRYRAFRTQYVEFSQRATEDGRFTVPWDRRLPQLNEQASLTVEPHYFYHPVWAARVLAQTRPQRHVDVSSILHWASITSAFVPIEYYELRPPALAYLDGLTVHQGDVTCLPIESGTVPSLSCMHALEHIGLGRYGDPIDPRGDEAGAAELSRVLAPNGDLLFVVPIGQGDIQFNAHRNYTTALALGLFPDLELVEFTLIHENAGRMGPHVDSLSTGDRAFELAADQRHGCGCFWLRKPARPADVLSGMYSGT